MRSLTGDFSTDVLPRLGSYSKVILFGEHAAVYGHPALAMGLADGMVVQQLAPREKGVHLVVQPWGLDVSEQSPQQLGEVLRILLQQVPGGPAGMDVALKASVPPGAGLGSSASLSVSLVKCLAWTRGVFVSDEDVRDMAHGLERIFHGNPSGLDDTVATFGGMCLFEKDGIDSAISPGSHRLSEQCIQLPFAIPGLVLGDTGVKRSTAAMVDSVRRQRQSDRVRVDGMFSQVDSCLNEGLQAMEKRDWSTLGQAMSRNHQLLCQLDLSCPEIEDMLGLAMEHGALGGKLTGAGGGGAVVVLAPGFEREIARAWKDAGFFAWSAAASEDTGGSND